MTSRDNCSATKLSPELIELSDSEEMYSISEEEITQAGLNNRRLTQAMNYLNQEGGEHSPATFVGRVNRIDDALLQQLPRQGRTFDTKLYRQVHAMVSDVQRDVENATERETLHLKSDKNMPKYDTPTAAEKALYLAGDSLPSSTPIITRPPPAFGTLAPKRPGNEDNVLRERKYKYGDPSNEAENWHKDLAASLPFLGMLMMADWKSLKIDFDHSRLREDTIVETNGPFDHEQFKPYFNLAQYGSSLPCKLPVVSREIQQAAAKYGTAIYFEDFVRAFNKEDVSERGVKDYAPRVLLEKFEVGNQTPPNIASPTQIRRAMAGTPSKSRTSSIGSTGTIPPKRGSPVCIEECLYETDDAPGTRQSADVELHTPISRRASVAKSNTPSTQPRAGSAIRAFDKEVRRSSGAQATFERATFIKRPSFTRTATQVEIPKRGRGRPRKTALLPDTPIQSSLGKRKPSAGSQPYSPPKSSIKKVLHNTRRQKLTRSKTAGFIDAPVALEEDSKDLDSPASPIKRPVRAAATGVSKTAAAGKQARKKRTPKDREEMVIVDEYERRIGKGRMAVRSAEDFKRGTTRSGVRFSV